MHADARRELFKKMGELHFEISVKEPAERNAANQRVRELLAEHFGVSVSKIRFITGMRGKNKTFDVIR